MFRGKLLDAIKLAGLAHPAELPEQWVVDCKSVGDGRKALLTLSRYLYRGVIQEKDILRCEDGKVTFQYRDAKTGKMGQRTLAGEDFFSWFSSMYCRTCFQACAEQETSATCTPTARAPSACCNCYTCEQCAPSRHRRSKANLALRRWPAHGGAEKAHAGIAGAGSIRSKQPAQGPDAPRHTARQTVYCESQHDAALTDRSNRLWKAG